MTSKEYSNILREMFPGDDSKVRLAFAVALGAEDAGDHEKAEDYLNKAIEAEEKVNAAA